MTRSLSKKITVKNKSDWDEVALFIQKEIFEKSTNAVLFLSGEVGAGKTTFIRSLAKVLGCPISEVASPTFAVHHRYQAQDITLDHLDLYRLETEDEIESVGLWDLFTNDEQSYIAIEWSERISEAHIPPNWPIVRIQITRDLASETRWVEISY